MWCSTSSPSDVREEHARGDVPQEDVLLEFRAEHRTPLVLVPRRRGRLSTLVPRRPNLQYIQIDIGFDIFSDLFMCTEEGLLAPVCPDVLPAVHLLVLLVLVLVLVLVVVLVLVCLSYIGWLLVAHLRLPALVPISQLKNAQEKSQEDKKRKKRY